MADLLDSTLLDRLMTLVEAPITIANLTQAQTQSSDVVYYHLLWLIKQGLISVQAPSKTAP